MRFAVYHPWVYLRSGVEQNLRAGDSLLLDARGAISVTERAGYIGRIRGLARAVAQVIEFLSARRLI